MIALLIISYIVVGYLNVLLACFLDKEVMHFDDSLVTIIAWPVIWAMLIIGGLCWIICIGIPRLCAGKKRV